MCLSVLYCQSQTGGGGGSSGQMGREADVGYLIYISIPTFKQLNIKFTTVTCL